ncbi:hypothetical protein GCM10027519_24430 [Kineococcus endophyticus]
MRQQLRGCVAGTGEDVAGQGHGALQGRGRRIGGCCTTGDATTSPDGAQRGNLRGADRAPRPTLGTDRNDHDETEENPVPDFGDITEKASDAAIDKAGDAADAKTGGGHAEQVDKAQQAADEKIGE